MDCIGSAVDLDTALEVAGGIFGNETLPDLSIVEPNSDAPTFIPGSLTLAVFERFRATYGVPPTSSDAFIPADALRFGNPHWHDKVRKLLKAGTVGLDLRGLLLSTAGSCVIDIAYIDEKQLADFEMIGPEACRSTRGPTAL